MVNVGAGGIARVLELDNGWTVTGDDVSGGRIIFTSPTGAQIIMPASGLLQGGGGNNWSITINGVMVVYAQQVTAAAGIIAERAATFQKQETTTDANVLTFTPPAIAATYRITVSVDITNSGGGTFGWTVAYKNSAGATVAPTNIAATKTGTAAPALTFAAVASGDHYDGTINIDVDNSGNAVVVKTTGPAATHYNISVHIEQLD